MTDARVPEKWLNDRRIQRLSDADFRSFIMALTWSVSNRTDGVIEPDDLSLIPQFAQGSAKALVAAGLWSAQKHGWSINGYESTQTTRERLAQLDAARLKERQKKARQRAAKAAALNSDNPNVPGDIPRDYTGQDRTGQDRLPAGGAHNGSSPFDSTGDAQ